MMMMMMMMLGHGFEFERDYFESTCFVYASCLRLYLIVEREDSPSKAVRATRMYISYRSPPIGPDSGVRPSASIVSMTRKKR